MDFIKKDGRLYLRATYNRWGEKLERDFLVYEGKIPSDFIIWNIGSNFQYLEDGWLPICKLLKGHDYTIDPDSLGCIYVGRDSVPFIDYVVSRYGLCSIKVIKKKISYCKSDTKFRIYLQALTVFKNIQEGE